MSQLPLWVQVAQAIALVVIAVVGAAIALGQLWLAGIRLRHDLYDRRLKVFEAAQRLLAAVFANAQVSPEEYYKYIQGTSESAFLLNAQIVAYLEQLRDRAAHMIHLSRRLRDEKLDDATRNKLADEEAETTIWFTQQPEALRAKFRPVMQLTRPWAFSSKWPFVAFDP